MRSASYVRASITSPFFASAKLIAFLTFLTFVLNGNVLTAETVFVVIAVYNPVRLVMNLFVPMAFQFMAEASVSIQRLQVWHHPLYAGCPLLRLFPGGRVSLTDGGCSRNNLRLLEQMALQVCLHGGAFLGCKLFEDSV